MRAIGIDDLDRMMLERGIGLRVRERILRLNPRGVEEGTVPRGWHPAPSLSREMFERNVVGRADLEAHGLRGLYASLPKEALVSRGGKRRAVKRSWLVDMNLST